jgi:hypothetical protein
VVVNWLAQTYRCPVIAFSVVFDEAENRLHGQKAVMEMLAAGAAGKVPGKKGAASKGGLALLCIRGRHP